jgi:hypothetical protein
MGKGVTVALPLWFVARANPINQPEPEPNRIVATDV